METTLTIDTDILNKAMQVSEEQNQHKLVENALRIFTFQYGQSKKIRKYRGKLQWKGNLDEMQAAKCSL